MSRSLLVTVLMGLASAACIPLPADSGTDIPPPLNDNTDNENENTGNTNGNIGGGNDNSSDPNDNAGENDNLPSNDNESVNENDNEGDAEVPLGQDIAIPNEGDDHVPVTEQVTYETNPPASGPHWSQGGGVAPVGAGFFELTVEEEQWVHNLEHGYIVILFDCDPCEDELLENLQTFFDNAPPSEQFGNVKLVITPYSGLPYLLTAVAWDVQLHLAEFDEDALLEFYESHIDEGPEGLP